MPLWADNRDNATLGCAGIFFILLATRDIGETKSHFGSQSATHANFISEITLKIAIGY